VTLQS